MSNLASLPQKITSDEECERLSDELEALCFADNLTAEERAYVEALTSLIMKYQKNPITWMLQP